MYAPPGWQDYLSPFWQPGQDAPYLHDTIEIWRPEWQKSVVVKYSEMNPAMNVNGLFWRVPSSHNP